MIVAPGSHPAALFARSSVQCDISENDRFPSVKCPFFSFFRGFLAELPSKAGPQSGDPPSVSLARRHCAIRRFTVICYWGSLAITWTLRKGLRSIDYTVMRGRPSRASIDCPAIQELPITCHWLALVRRRVITRWYNFSISVSRPRFRDVSLGGRFPRKNKENKSFFTGDRRIFSYLDVSTSIRANLEGDEK